MTAKKETRVYYSFVALLIALILWSSGSVAMRMQLWPSISFWNYVSVFGILMLPVMYYHFVLDFLEEKRSYGRYFWLVVFLVMAGVNQLTDWLIPTPDVRVVDGVTQFVYRYHWPIYLVFGIVALCLGQLALIIRRYCKRNRAAMYQLIPVIAGMAVLFAGHMAATLPIFLGFPLDIISGCVNAVLLIYAWCILLSVGALVINQVSVETRVVIFCVLFVGSAVFAMRLHLFEPVLRHHYNPKTHQDEIVSPDDTAFFEAIEEDRERREQRHLAHKPRHFKTPGPHDDKA